MTSLPVNRWYLLLLSLLFSFVIRPQEQSRQIINKCEKYNTTNKKVSANTKRILSHGEEQKTDRLNFKHSYSTESAENLQITNQTPVCYAKRSGKECGQYRASLGWWLILGYGTKRQGLCAKKCTIVISGYGWDGSAKMKLYMSRTLHDVWLKHRGKLETHCGWTTEIGRASCRERV